MKVKRILIMGLPGSGKTTLAKALENLFVSIGKSVVWYNADHVREQNNNWDFSEEGRIRQSTRMRELADAADADYVICDFVAPLVVMRQNFDADYTIWIDTVTSSEYDDTDRIFVPPKKYNFCVNTKDAAHWAPQIAKHILFLENLNETKIQTRLYADGTNVC
jgi:adenylylsulfate kinase